MKGNHNKIGQLTTTTEESITNQFSNKSTQPKQENLYPPTNSYLKASTTSQKNLNPPNFSQNSITSSTHHQNSKVENSNIEEHSSMININEDVIIIKDRQCPNCGAKGFDIIELMDRTHIVNHCSCLIYGKKLFCMKCRSEF